MIATQHTQSLAEFSQKPTETLDRLNRTGEAEVLTVNGEARAVLIAPDVFDELTRQAQLTSDVASIREAMKQADEGNYKEASEFFGGLRAQLLAIKASAPAKP